MTTQTDTTDPSPTRPGRFLILAILAIAATFLSLASGCNPPASDYDRLKAEIMIEVMTEVRKQFAAHGATGEDFAQTRAQLKTEIEREIIRKLQMLAPESDIAKAAAKIPDKQAYDGPTGSAEGQFLRRGKGLPKCRVKLVRLVVGETVIGLLKVLKEQTDAEFEAVTDDNGKYRFEKLPVGAYKLKWVLPGDTGWIRRLREKPDVTIEAGKTSTLKPVETARRLVPR